MSARQETPAPKTRDLSQQEVAELSPSQRDAYFDQKAKEGVSPDNWLFGPLQQWIAQVQGKSQSDKVGDQNVKDSSQGRDVEYVQGLQPSSTDYKGIDHTQLQQYLNTNLDVQQVTGTSDAYHSVHKVFDSFATSMNEAVNKSKGTWEGGAADSAQAYFSSLGKWSEANSQNAKLASETIYDQGQAASTAKNAMPEPIKFSWGDEFKSWATSNPFNLADNVDKSIQKQKDSQAAHDEAAGVMSTYDNNLYAAASKQPAFAPPPAFDAGGGDGTGDKNGNENGNGNGNGNGNTHFSTGPVPNSGGPGNSGFSSGSGGPGTGTSGLVGGPTGGPTGPGAMTGSGTVPSGGLAPAAFNPGNVPPPSSNPSNSSMPMGGMPMGGMPMGGMGGMGGESDYSGKVGRGGGGGGFGPGGSASGSGTTGPGSASGAARPGGIGAAESAAGRGMGGLGSGAGRGGMGGGGMGRGQGAKGEEDAEHTRPTYLVEGDPDEVFGTDLRTAPPVIGE